MAGLEGHTLGHYRLVEEIGRGGMATVCRAVDIRTNTEVAIKVLSPTISGDNRFVQRFKRESSLLAGLKHPNIIPVIGYGESKGMVFMVMPYVKGESLQGRIEDGKFNKKERERWIHQIADALVFAHSQGIIHRDVKPSNVMIDKSGNAHLMDFGLAREVEGSNTLTGSMLLGTPAYMAPEQGRGDLVDERSDQYSLGIIIYQMLTGQLPFEADSPMGTVLKHIQEPVPRPSRFVPKMSQALERVILKCLAKDPEYRYPTVGAFYEAYKAARDGATIADLDLETVVVPLEPILREAQGPYRAQADAVGRSGGRGSRIWVALLAVLPLALIGAILASPQLSSVLGAVFGQQPTPSQSPATEPVSSPIPLPTDSSPEPTLVPTPITFQKLGCPDVLVHAPISGANSMVWVLDNADAEPVEFEFKEIAYPEVNESITKIQLGNVVVWEGETQGGELDLGEAKFQSLPGLSATELTLEFIWSPALLNYRLVLDFGEGCELIGNW
ncbi:MAG: protein kinase [Anaerolineales bacterium]|nr:protein kinase [Anaerolineales bacterium]